MPCDTIRTVQVSLENADLDLLVKALTELGYYGVKRIGDRVTWNGGSYDRRAGYLDVRSETTGDMIKREYSFQLVKREASRFNWRLSSNPNNKYELEAVRR